MERTGVLELWMFGSQGASRETMRFASVVMKTKTLLVVMVAFGPFFAAVNPAVAQTWTPVASNNTWTCVAWSADGAKIVAGSQFKPVYLSTNSGATWAATSTPSNLWTSIAASADGSRLVALAAQWQDGLIYRSTNSGVDWIPTSAPGTPNVRWGSVACSADGRIVVATTTPGGIYRSLDSGATWTVTRAPNTNHWTSIACSADGTRLAAASGNYAVPPYFSVPGAIYLSSDSGETWAKASAPEGKLWVSIACSADGTRLIAAESLVYVSTNSGATWTTAGVPPFYPHVASSADGTRLAAAGYPGLIYFSTDSAATWTATGAGSNYWSSLASSADGNAWLAVDAGHGLVCKSQSTPEPLLGIAPAAGNLALSWPVPSMGFVLQQNSDLSLTNWGDVTSTPVLNLTNLQNEVILTPTDSGGFYRLAIP
jgi:hypothetical protein